MRRVSLVALAVSVVLTAPGALAHAQGAGGFDYTSRQPDEAPTQEGIYLHVRAGLSAFGFFGKGSSERAWAAGSAIDAGFAIGRFLVPGTALYVAIDATFLPARMHESSIPMLDAHGVAGGALGVGLVRYLPGSSTFVGGALSVEFLTFSGYPADDPMNVGPVGRFELGHEWALSEGGAVGMAGYVTGGWLHGVPSNDVPSPMESLGSLGGGLVATLTLR
ncbi:MAG: hypothetical protein U0230_28445 [Polyangiales bacterium]